MILLNQDYQDGIETGIRFTLEAMLKEPLKHCNNPEFIIQHATETLLNDYLEQEK